MEAYCVKCRTKRFASDIIETVFKNGRPVKKGKCDVCGTTVCKITKVVAAA